MDVEELKALARAVEPLDAAGEGPDCGQHVVAYNHLVSRFRERVTTALNSLSLFEAIPPELQQELRLMAKALPDERCKAEVAAQQQAQTDPVE